MVNSINLNMKSIEVEAEIRSLNVSWSREMVQDLQSYHGFDPDELILQLLKDFRKENRKKSIKNIFSL